MSAAYQTFVARPSWTVKQSVPDYDQFPPPPPLLFVPSPTGSLRSLSSSSSSHSSHSSHFASPTGGVVGFPSDELPRTPYSDCEVDGDTTTATATAAAFATDTSHYTVPSTPHCGSDKPQSLSSQPHYYNCCLSEESAVSERLLPFPAVAEPYMTAIQRPSARPSLEYNTYRQQVSAISPFTLASTQQTAAPYPSWPANAIPSSTLSLRGAHIEEEGEMTEATTGIVQEEKQKASEYQQEGEQEEERVVGLGEAKQTGPHLRPDYIHWTHAQPTCHHLSVQPSQSHPHHRRPQQHPRYQPYLPSSVARGLSQPSRPHLSDYTSHSDHMAHHCTHSSLYQTDQQWPQTEQHRQPPNDYDRILVDRAEPMQQPYVARPTQRSADRTTDISPFSPALNHDPSVAGSFDHFAAPQHVSHASDCHPSHNYWSNPTSPSTASARSTQSVPSTSTVSNMSTGVHWPSSPAFSSIPPVPTSTQSPSSLVQWLRIPDGFALLDHVARNAHPFVLLFDVVHASTKEMRTFATALKTPLLPGYDVIEQRPSISHMLLTKELCREQSMRDDWCGLSQPAQWLAMGSDANAALHFERLPGLAYQRSVAHFGRKWTNTVGDARGDGACPVAEECTADELSGWVQDAGQQQLGVVVTPQLRQDLLVDHRNRSFAVLHPTRQYKMEVCGAGAAEWKVRRVRIMWSAPGSAAEDANRRRFKVWAIYRRNNECAVLAPPERGSGPPLVSSDKQTANTAADSSADTEEDDSSEDDDDPEIQRMLAMLQLDEQRRQAKKSSTLPPPPASSVPSAESNPQSSPPPSSAALPLSAPLPAVDQPSPTSLTAPAHASSSASASASASSDSPSAVRVADSALSDTIQVVTDCLC